jgi:hypothetical protein
MWHSRQRVILVEHDTHREEFATLLLEIRKRGLCVDTAGERGPQVWRLLANPDRAKSTVGNHNSYYKQKLRTHAFSRWQYWRL